MIAHNMGKSYYEISATPKDLDAPVSKSLLWFFYQSPYRFLHTPKQQKSSAAMALGSLAHCALLTPELMDSEYIVSPYADYRKKEAQDWKAANLESGKLIVSQDDYDKANDMADVIRACNEFPRVYNPEVAVFGEIEGVKIKGMIDIVPETGSALYDLKTISKIESLHDLQRKILDYGYHWQAALYLDLWNAASGESRDEFVFVFVETTAPYETAFVKLTPEFIELGRHGSGRKKYSGYMDAVKLWKKCVSTNSFPKQIDGLQTIEVPTWIILPTQ